MSCAKTFPFPRTLCRCHPYSLLFTALYRRGRHVAAKLRNNLGAHFNHTAFNEVRRNRLKIAPEKRPTKHALTGKRVRRLARRSKHQKMTRRKAPRQHTPVGSKIKNKNRNIMQGICLVRKGWRLNGKK